MATCPAVVILLDDELHCRLEAGHDAPVTPDGEEPRPVTAHESDHQDSLTGEPWRWW